MVPGSAKFAWLMKLKASNLSCKLNSFGDVGTLCRVVSIPMYAGTNLVIPVDIAQRSGDSLNARAARQRALIAPGNIRAHGFYECAAV